MLMITVVSMWFLQQEQKIGACFLSHTNLERCFITEVGKNVLVNLPFQF
jgi:hypothetical protein